MPKPAPWCRTHLPRDFIPMKRFSTMSIRPTPCLPLKKNRSLGLRCCHKAWGQRPPIEQVPFFGLAEDLPMGRLTVSGSMTENT